MVPFGLHLGWNTIYNTVFSKGPLREVLIITKGGNTLTDWASLLTFLSGLIIIPVLELVLIKYFVKDEIERIELKTMHYNGYT